MRQEPEQRRRIQRLDAEVVGKIAAGEVVENPAAMIKELVENSIDAGASSITVEIREGGIAYTRVTDNGCGIGEQDIRLAFERHATSKIRTAEELMGVVSLGFRGEALASIAAVAKVRLTTRTAQQEQGICAKVNGGVFEGVMPAASPEGTSIIVEDLFYNTPVRLKFLKKPRTEGGRVADVLQRLMLSHPEITFRLVVDGRQVYRTPGDGKLRSVAMCLYGRETAQDLLEVDGASIGIKVHGLVGVGNAAKSSRAFESFFLNGRSVRHSVLSRAVEQACAERVTIGHYPLCVLHVQMPGEWMDVNVHPNKLDVRFSDEQRVFHAVCDAVRQAVQERHTLHTAPQIHLTPQTPEEQAPPPPDIEVLRPPEDAVLPRETKPENVQPFAEVVQSYFQGMQAPKMPEPRVRNTQAPAARTVPDLSFAPYPAESSHPEQAQEAATPSTQDFVSEPPQEPQDEKIYFQLIGVAFSTYLIVESEQKLLLIDQHAAHERILYERFSAALGRGEGSQALLAPLAVPLTPAQSDRLITYAKEVREAGFDVELMGHDSAQVRSIPMILGEPAARQAFEDMLEQLGDLRVLGTQQKRRDAIVQMSCKRAIKGGDRLSDAEIEALLREMRESEAPPTCPHGRPLVVVLSRRELEKKFKRIQ